MTLEEILQLEKVTAEKECAYAKQGMMYGSADYTDFSLACDFLLELFEAGKSVEEALHEAEQIGYDLTLFDYHDQPLEPQN